MKLLISITSLLLLFFLSSCKNKKVFKLITSKESGITFNNRIIEDSSINPITLEFIYNGSGVSVGDFNMDGLPDLYFTGSRVKNELYINKGNFKFKNVTDVSGTSSEANWSSSASIVDINNDGKPDIYVSNSISHDSKKRANQLYLNLGINKDGDPLFKEVANEYNLADTGHTVMTAFFDYDNDGDLDAYLVQTKPIDRIPTSYKTFFDDSISISNDKLLRNDFDSLLGHSIFTDISKVAGISLPGYGLGVNIADINNDGWKDIFVTNDFNNSDHLYINNKNGSFAEKSKYYFKHTSFNAMGNDIADINNDCLLDVLSVDMNAKDNFRKKMNLSANSYQGYMNLIRYNYNIQYVRNTLQLNQGYISSDKNDTSNRPIYSEIAFMTNLAETDWSWSPLIADVNNDGYRDVLITNGYPRDVTDNDFVSYRNEANNFATWDNLLQNIPQIKIANYVFKNNGALQFDDVTNEWGFSQPTFSNGAATVDLDADGDLDYVVNNINDFVSLYENRISDIEENNFIQFKLKGSINNLDGYGAELILFYDTTKKQYADYTPYRGYLSSLEPIVHFGLGKTSSVDSLVILWPDGKKETLLSPKINSRTEINYSNAISSSKTTFEFLLEKVTPLFTNISDSLNINYTHDELDFVDFNIQKLLPHKLSEYGPGMAVADLDGNGTDDLFIGGSYPYRSTILFQNLEGNFEEKSLNYSCNIKQQADEMGILIFDIDNDNDNDIYISSGGFENPSNSISYSDHLFLNDGRGNFKEDTVSLVKNYSSKSCVRASDYDKDGDLDLFLAGRVEPWKYPISVSSYIYRNDSKNGIIKLTDVTSEIAPELQDIGLTSDAIFSDFDNDGWEDLILVGEWMPMKLFKNKNGRFVNYTLASGINQETGFWTSISPGDFDNDGDIDYAIGNMGLNSFYRASKKYPVKIYSSDFNQDGNYDAIPSLYLHSSFNDKTIREFPSQTRDDLVKQMINIRSKFPNYKSFASSTMDMVLSKTDFKKATIKSVVNLKSSILLNDGTGKFTISSMPIPAQISPINGMVVDDFNSDGNLDILMCGNDFGTEVSVGRYDAFNGLLMKGNGKGGFTALSISESGIYIPGNAKSMVKLMGLNNSYIVVTSQNRDKLRVNRLNSVAKLIRANPNEKSALLEYKNGIKRKIEFSYGYSFLSQSANFFISSPMLKKVTFFGIHGITRTINYN